MYEQLIKEWILSNQFRVYSVIADTYFEQLETLKPLLFRKWLAKELSIDEEKINLHSLSSALVRHRQKLKKHGKDIKTNHLKCSSKSPDQKNSFPFSKDDGLPQKENIIEL